MSATMPEYYETRMRGRLYPRRSERLAGVRLTRLEGDGLMATGIRAEDELVAQATHCAMGTVITHKAFGLHAEDSLAAVCREVTRIEQLLSCFLPNSEISRVNGYAGTRSVRVSLETYDVLSEAVEFSRVFSAYFDVTIGPLVALWKMGIDSCTQPDESSIKQALPLVNYRDLTLDPVEMTVGLKNAGQSVDPGGIGKGFAGDKILEIFRNFSISSAYSNLGGNVVTWGTKPNGSSWQIGVQHPRQENRLIGYVSVVGKTVVAAGDYQRCFTDSRGIRYHHILDPSTGYPAQSGLVSATIVAERSLVADALSTMVFVAGMENGLELLRGYPRAEAILVDTDLQVFVTQGLKYCFQADEGIEVTFVD
jgi:thiamine biosynthesis lipoprotein